MDKLTDAQRRDRWCEVRPRRAEDLTDLDVIRWGGRWTEVQDVIRDMDDWDAVYGPSMADERQMAADALDWPSPVYVVLRLFDIENSVPDELVNMFVKVYRFELVDTQVLPAWGPGPENTLADGEQPEPGWVVSFQAEPDHQHVLMAAHDPGLSIDVPVRVSVAELGTMLMATRPPFEAAGYSTDAAAGELQELLSVDEQTARAILTVAASDVGEVVLNGVRVRGDDDAQEFVIEPAGSAG